MAALHEPVALDPEKQGPVVDTVGAEAVTTDTDTDGSVKQEGIKQVEAITAVWSRKQLWLTFVFLWLVSFALALLGSVEGTLTPYITSSFEEHGLLSIISIAARIIGGVIVLSIGKFIDIRGRLQGFIGAILLIIIGMIMKATCKNIQTYAAAHVFYWVGNTAMGYIIEVFVADITTLRNRMIIFSLNSTPNIITTFAGPKIADLFYENLNFRWAFGALMIVVVGISLPVFGIMGFNERKAKKMGLVRPRSNRTLAQSTWYYLVQFDVLGMVLISAGFALILLPFSLVNTAGGKWDAPHIIAMLVVGVVSLAAFICWEKFFAPVMFFPFELLRDRTVLGACITYFVVFLTTFIWDAYYSSYLQVVHDLNIVNANYVLNGYSLCAYFTGPFIALYIRSTGQVKWPAVAAVPIYILATALILHFRHPGTYVGYLAMCQILTGFGSGLLCTMSQLALMAAVSHGNVAVAIAIYGLFASIGSATGYAIAGGIWTNTLPEKILKYLPEESKGMAAAIYGDLEKQMAYPIGHPIRDAVIHAYSDVMEIMCIAGACLIPIALVSVLMWRNVNVKKEQHVEKARRGNVW